MMSRFRYAFNGLKRLIGLSNVKDIKFVGEDHLGNRYYEKTIVTSKGPVHRRSAEGKTKDVTQAEIPPEWDAWLRRTRANPPTEEEINMNYMMKLRTQQKAMEIEEQYREEQKELHEQKISTDMSSASLREKRQFPTYEEYEIMPGEAEGRQKNNKR